jgi:predicted RNase H-like HicB family nuclease
MAAFVALIHRESGSDYGASFPDFPGCVSAGTTLDEVALIAREALAGHVAVMTDHGDPLPEQALGLDQAMALPEAQGAIPLLVEVELPGPRVRANISIEEGLLGRIDRAATARGMSRSAFLAEAARRVLAG